MLVVLTQENHIWLSHYANGVPVDVGKDGKNEIDYDNHPMFRRRQLSNKDTSESCWLGPVSCFHIVWMRQLSNKDTSESCWLGPLSCFHIVWMRKKGGGNGGGLPALSTSNRMTDPLVSLSNYFSYLACSQLYYILEILYMVSVCVAH